MKKGFTLIELLLVIGIIAILAAIVIVAINPTRQLGQARDTQRANSVRTILNAATQYYVDNGNRAGCLDSSGAVTLDDVASCTDLATDLATYIPGGAMPTDPVSGQVFQIGKTAEPGGVVTVCAPGAEVYDDPDVAGSPNPICNSL